MSLKRRAGIRRGGGGACAALNRCFPYHTVMAFMMKKKKYRFNVEVQLHDLDNVTWINEVIFAKIRLLDGGSFQEYCSR